MGRKAQWLAVAYESEGKLVSNPEPVFVNLLRSAGIDSHAGGPVRQRQPYSSYRPAWPHRLAESIPRNRFLGAINV
jgi:hypothetical protein